MVATSPPSRTTSGAAKPVGTSTLDSQALAGVPTQRQMCPEMVAAANMQASCHWTPGSG
ncbi:Hypothetical predicted protein, partial [Marmota monax]